MESSGSEYDPNAAGTSDPLPPDFSIDAIEGVAKIMRLTVLVGKITILEAHDREAFIHGSYFLIERCLIVEVLLEIVRMMELSEYFVKTTGSSKYISWLHEVFPTLLSTG